MSAFNSAPYTPTVRTVPDSPTIRNAKLSVTMTAGYGRHIFELTTTCYHACCGAAGSMSSQSAKPQNRTHQYNAALSLPVGLGRTSMHPSTPPTFGHSSADTNTQAAGGLPRRYEFTGAIMHAACKPASDTSNFQPHGPHLSQHQPHVRLQSPKQVHN
ncbi:uncharacterized protein SETTUDRAFT_31720 [Exserohilum turcica Et28A]|uniref:Uncharacterized protein n=1 Tax=Exserohilum turcicum (strain 28A) TaxID=671987 RepID=R0KDN8_EXST2|nr:uncharacterized protein SETTUDRAFT_31720 [Exserohilum turcica Et28A]EOA87464.1 hypothetical protein SETTUDRAFT_31720 [Exserohilum turcica Et28A]